MPAAVLLTLHMEARLPDLKTDRLSADPDACIEFGENATEKVRRDRRAGWRSRDPADIGQEEIDGGVIDGRDDMV